MTYEQTRLLLQFINWLDANGMLDTSALLMDNEVIHNDDTLYLRLIEEFENDG